MFVTLWIYHYRLITIESGKQKELMMQKNSANRIYRKTKKIDNNGNATSIGDEKNKFVLTSSKKIKENELKIPHGSVTIL